MIFCLAIGGGTVASEEVSYHLVEKNEIYEIRYYEPVLVAEVEYTGVNSGFGDLFNYISGANSQALPAENTATWHDTLPSIMTPYPNPSGAINGVRFGAMKSPALGGIANFCKSMPIRSARQIWALMPRFA